MFHALADRPQLLVSARSAREAKIAAAVADIVDIKNPTEGPLGAADPAVWADVVSASTRHLRTRPITLALGEPSDWNDRPVPTVPEGIAAVKLGPGDRSTSNDRRAVCVRFEEAAQRPLPWVAVAYADRKTEWDDWVTKAVDANCVALLIDTADKRGPSLGQLWTDTELKQQRRRADDASLPLVLAGRLRTEEFSRFAAYADVIGVRSAACRQHDRQSEMTRESLQQCRVALGQAVEEQSLATASPL